MRDSLHEKKLSEELILKCIHDHFPLHGSNTVLSRGDDCALLDFSQNENKYIAVTTDIFSENVHFRCSYFTPEAIGYKALAVNISDIYSMGAKPSNCFLALTVPPATSWDFLERMFASMADLAKEHHITLAGGDISTGETLSLSITLLGLVDKEVKLYRNKCAVHDIVYICGEIGLSRLALELLENNKDILKYQQALKAHFFPKMQSKASQEIAEFAKKYAGFSFSLMDISDGLARDLGRLVQSKGVKLTLDETCLHKEIKEYCAYDSSVSLNPFEFAIVGGEDYALLGTCPSDLWNEFRDCCSNAKAIGFVCEEKGLYLNNIPLNLIGFDHFI